MQDEDGNRGALGSQEPDNGETSKARVEDAVGHILKTPTYR